MLFLIGEALGLHDFQLWLVFTSIYATFANALAIAATMVWAPFGALICALIARRRGLSSRRYAIAGAACSALFFMPWVYLTARMSGRATPKPLVVLSYVLLYASWIIGPELYIYSLSSLVVGVLPGSLWVFVWLVNALTLIASLLLMTTPIAKKINLFRHEIRDDVSMQDALPNPVYLLPFALLWAWTAVLIALTFLSANAEG